MAVTAGFYIAEGWMSRSELYINGADITALPIQTDMVNGRQWIRPSDLADVVRPARLVDTPSGTRFGYGGLIWKWPMVNLSPNMVKYLQETYFSPAGAPSNFYNRTWSNQLTVQTFNRASGDWETYHTFARFANFDGEADMSAGGYNNLQINFTAVASAPDGPDLSTGVVYAEGTTVYDTLSFSFSVTATNIGDDDTWSTNQLDYAVPTELDFVSVTSGASITTTYSVNNGVSYSGTPPGDLTTVTNVRVVYNPVIASLNTSTAIVFTMTPNTNTGTVANTVVFTTIGDVNTANDTATTNLTLSPIVPTTFDNLTVWLSGDTSVFIDEAGTNPVVTSGNLVGHWGDGSPVTSNDYTQATDTNKPTYQPAQINGEPIIRFDGTNDYLTGSDLSAQITATSFSIFVVFIPTASSTNSATIQDNDAIFATQTSGQLGLHIRSDNSMYATMYDGTAQRNIASTWVTSTAIIVELRLASLVFSLVKDNGVRQTLAVSAGVNDDTVIMELGRNYTGEFYDGDIAEFIVYDTALSDTDSDYVRGYLNSKYAVY